MAEGVTFPPCSRSTLSEPNTVSVAAFSQPLSLRLIDPRMPYRFNSFWKSALAYWETRSEWKINPLSGWRRNYAMVSASMTSCRVMRSPIAQPMS